jgi:hypothetical protein
MPERATGLATAAVGPPALEAAPEPRRDGTRGAKPAAQRGLLLDAYTFGSNIGGLDIGVP